VGALMVTLMIVGNAEGERRCDERCYDAKSPVSECECCCNGRNHGAGRGQAEVNTAEHATQMLKDYCERKNLVGSELWAAVQRNLDLFRGGAE